MIRNNSKISCKKLEVNNHIIENSGNGYIECETLNGIDLKHSELAKQFLTAKGAHITAHGQRTRLSGSFTLDCTQKSLAQQIREFETQHLKEKNQLISTEKESTMQSISSSFFNKRPYYHGQYQWSTHKKDPHVRFMLFEKTADQTAQQLAHDLKEHGLHAYQSSTRSGKLAVSVHLLK